MLPRGGSSGEGVCASAAKSYHERNSNGHTLDRVLVNPRSLVSRRRAPNHQFSRSLASLRRQWSTANYIDSYSGRAQTRGAFLCVLLLALQSRSARAGEAVGYDCCLCQNALLSSSFHCSLSSKFGLKQHPLGIGCQNSAAVVSSQELHGESFRQTRRSLGMTHHA